MPPHFASESDLLPSPAVDRGNPGGKEPAMRSEQLTQRKGHYSLWLVPSAVEMGLIKSVLPRASDTDPPLSPRSYVAFHPHITLATVFCSDPEIAEELIDTVPKVHRPIRANFLSLVVGDHYFRSVFIDIERTQELVDFQDKIFTNLRDRSFDPHALRFPHMSLCYIADEDDGCRKMTAQALRDTGVVAETQPISLKCGGVNLPGFDSREVWVVNCEGPAETWQVERVKRLISES